MKQVNILAMDFGEKKIGLAFKPKGFFTGEALGNIKNQGDVIKKIIDIIKEKKINIIVIGYPTYSNMKKSSITHKVEKFADSLKSCLPAKKKLVLTDENFSTKEALAKLRFSGKSEKFIKKNKDTYSALLILERFLKDEGV